MKDKQKKKDAVIYCRVSTKEQIKNLSLSTQREICEDYCARNEVRVAKVFVEKGESASTADRPQFRELLAYCTEHRSHIGYVVVHSLSRFARNTADHHIVRALLGKHGITLRSATEPIDDTSSGRLLETVIGGVAQFENDRKSELAVERMQAALKLGRWTFQAPLGYITQPVGKTSPSLLHDPKTAPLIRKAFEMFATGRYSKRDVLRKLNAVGLRTKRGRPLTAQSLSSILKNPIYTGRVVVPRWCVDLPGDFEPIVSESLFRTVQALLRDRRPNSRRHLRNHPDFPLRRFALCSSCGGPMTANWVQRGGRRYGYYRCWNPRCSARGIRRRVLHGRFLVLLRSLKVDARVAIAFKEVVLDSWKERQAKQREWRRSIERRVSNLDRRKELLVEAFVYNKTIDQATYAAEVERIDMAVSEAAMEIQRGELGIRHPQEVVDFAARLLTEPDKFWQEAPLEPKQRFQWLTFPKGIECDAQGIKNAVTSTVFSMLQATTAQNDGVASLATRNSNALDAWLREVGRLRHSCVPGSQPVTGR